ncbi:DUF6894 family protein [Sphingomonas sp.]|jgi:hypothetical protein|uniref:DUF6894 family protein n=1 Tax=Sphingomonas sp. TaxID=28214 RepID=UPI002ED8DF20
MARYYFNLHDGMEFPDNQGREFANLQEARNAALEYACEMMRASGEAWEGEEALLQVTDERGTPLFTLAFSGTDIFTLAD